LHIRRTHYKESGRKERVEEKVEEKVEEGTVRKERVEEEGTVLLYRPHRRIRGG
jgi:hypothetical protein